MSIRYLAAAAVLVVGSVASTLPAEAGWRRGHGWHSSHHHRVSFSVGFYNSYLAAYPVTYVAYEPGFYI